MTSGSRPGRSKSFRGSFFKAKQQGSGRKPAALLLYEFIKLSYVEEGMGEVELAAVVSPDIKNASIVVMTVIPILIVYPFMQKYFVKGTMVGAVKG